MCLTFQPPLRAYLSKTVQNVGAQSSSIEAAQAKVSSAEADFENVRVQSARIFKLERLDSVSKAEADDARTERTEAESALKEASAELDNARKQLGPVGNENTPVSPFEKLQANLVAAFASLVAYELIVIVPNVIMMGLISALLCLGYGSWLSSGHRKSHLARSALTGALILLGSAMLPLADTIAVSAIERVLEISAAVILATVTFEALNHVLPEETSVADKRGDIEKQILIKI